MIKQLQIKSKAQILIEKFEKVGLSNSTTRKDVEKLFINEILIRQRQLRPGIWKSKR